MKPLIPAIIALTGQLAVAGCATTTGNHLETGCPPGQVRVEDEQTGEYDCASEKDYEDMMDVLDEHGRRDTR